MRMWRASASAAALLAVMGIAATGCSGSEDGEAEPTEAAEPWDPCSLSDAALQRAGLDPATEGPGLTANAPGEKSCGWKNDDISVIMTDSTTATVEQFRNGRGNVEVRDVTVGGRSGFTYLDEADKPDTYCDLVVPNQSNSVMTMQVARSPLTKDTTPICEWAVRTGDVLVAEMPN